MLDATIAWDDALCERFLRCQVCLRAAQTIDTFLVSGSVVAISRCQRCASADKDGVKLLAQLSQREARPLKET